MSRGLRAGLILGLLGAPLVARAGKADAVERHLEDGDDEGARKKCERWEASRPSTESAVREACARAYYLEARQADTVVAWATFRSTWKGTEMARQAVEREAEAALRTLDLRAPESELLALAEAYPDTMAGDEARLAARDAAVRDAASPEEAVAVARRYPDHPGLPRLVERFPEGFFTVEVAGSEVKWAMEPEIMLPASLEPRVRWVARDDDGILGDWDKSVQAELLEGGVTVAALQRLRPEDGRALPLCFVLGKDPDFRPAAVLQVGQGEVLVESGWDETCGPGVWPVFIAVQGRRVSGFSLTPGHRVDLGPVSDTQRSDLGPSVAGLSRDTVGVLLDGLVYERGSAAWLVHPVSGGVPWLSALAPPDGGTPLDASLRGPPMPRGWRVAPEAGGNRIYSSSIGADKPPWRLASGDVRLLSPMVQRVLGLSAADAQPDGPRAPALSAAVPFQQSSEGLVLPKPPEGGGMAGLYAVEPGELGALQDQLAGVGLGDVKILDAWRSDLDGDKVPETLLRGERQGEGLALLLDPYKKNAPRVFAWRCEEVRMNGKGAPTPFAFRYQDHVYLAWAGMTQVDAATWDSWVVALRADGVSYALDELHRTLGAQAP